MPQFRCPNLGFFTRRKGCLLGLSMLAWLTASSLAWGQQLEPITLTPLDANTTTGYATFGSHNQKVVVNAYGIFVSYLHAGTPGMAKTQWRLARSVDDGASFTTIDESPAVGDPSAESTYPPLLETDSTGSIYVIRTQSALQTGHAYLRVYRPWTNFARPATQVEIPYGSGQKYSMVLDEARGQIYYAVEKFRVAPATHGELYFYTIRLDGTVLPSVRLAYSQNADSNSSYPHLTMDEGGDLYVAWNNSTPAELYYSMQMMRSHDGGWTWESLSGTAISLPVDTDSPLPTMINDSLEINRGNQLWTIRVKEGKIHLPYYVAEFGHQRYVRFDTVTGQKDVNLTGWSGETLDVLSIDGFCTASNSADHTVYCVSRLTDAPDRLAVLVSYDNGLTWHDHAVTEHLGITPYGITGAREIRDGHIVGMFTLENSTSKTVHFFRIPVTTPATQRLHAVAVTTNGALPGYPATNAIDANPQTLWVDSSPNNNAWIMIDLGTIRQIDRVRFHSGLGTPYPAYSPGDYTISVSDNGQNWTTVVTRTNLMDHINGNEPVGMSGRFVKLTTTKVNDGSGWSLSFHEFWAEGTAMPATRLPATTGGVQTPGYETGKANDGRFDTQFVASLTPAPQNNIAAFDLYFATHRQVARVKWVAATGYPYPAGAPRDFVIQTSDNGFNWTTVASRSAPDYTGSISAGSIPINRSVRQIRILTSAVWDATGWSLSFLEFWAEGW